MLIPERVKTKTIKNYLGERQKSRCHRCGSDARRRRSAPSHPFRPRCLAIPAPRARAARLRKPISVIFQPGSESKRGLGIPPAKRLQQQSPTQAPGTAGQRPVPDPVPPGPRQPKYGSLEARRPRRGPLWVTADPSRPRPRRARDEPWDAPTPTPGHLPSRCPAPRWASWRRCRARGGWP